MNRRVVITGLGAVSGLGLNVPAFWQELEAGRSGIRPFDLPIKNVKTSVAAPVPGFDSEKYFTAEELSLLELMSRISLEQFMCLIIQTLIKSRKFKCTAKV